MTCFVSGQRSCNDFEKSFQSDRRDLIRMVRHRRPHDLSTLSDSSRLPLRIWSHLFLSEPNRTFLIPVLCISHCKNDYERKEPFLWRPDCRLHSHALLPCVFAGRCKGLKQTDIICKISHSMTRANLKTSWLTNNTAASKYIPKRPRIYISCGRVVRDFEREAKNKCNF